jgi:hypothetical protein
LGATVAANLKVAIRAEPAFRMLNEKLNVRTALSLCRERRVVVQFEIPLGSVVP